MVDVIYQDQATPVSGSYTLKNNYGTWNYGSGGDTNLVYRKGVRRPRPKDLDMTPYELRLVKSEGVRGTWSNYIKSNNPQNYSGLCSDRINDGSTRFRVYPNYRAPDSNIAEVSRLTALSKLNRKDIDFGTAFAEAGKTAQLVGDIAHFTVDVVRALARRDLRALRRAFESDVSHGLPTGQTAVDGYLAYHYGVKPALKDVAGSVEAMTRLPPEQWSVRSKGRYANEQQKVRRGIAFAQTFVNSVSNARDSARTVVWCTRTQTSRSQDLRWALGLDDPLSTAWELTPFSFVYDWLVPIGDWLAAINASKYYTGWSVATTQYLRERTIVTGDSGKSGSNDYTSSVKGFCETLFVKRSVSTGLPITGIPLKDPVSLDHMAKGLSLLATTLARHGEPPRFLRY